MSLQSPINVRIEREFNGEKGSKLIDTTLGRLIFNACAAAGHRLQASVTCLDDMFALEIDTLVRQEAAGQDRRYVLPHAGRATSAHWCWTTIKVLGYKYSTVGSLSPFPLRTLRFRRRKSPRCWPKRDKKVDDDRTSMFAQGLLSEDERYSRVIDLWNTTHRTPCVTRSCRYLDKFNPIRMMTDSGARGSAAQVSQLAGMRGLMASPTGKTVELPIRANFREGLNVLEFFLSSHGSRKALSDTRYANR